MESKGRPDFRIIGENNGVIFKCSEDTQEKVFLELQVHWGE